MLLLLLLELYVVVLKKVEVVLLLQIEAKAYSSPHQTWCGGGLHSGQDRRTQFLER